MRSRIGTSSLAAIGLAAATLTGIALGATSVVSPASAANTYTVADVQAHKTSASCWSIVDGNVYDLTNWITAHRGGSAVIIGMCGVDASAAFHGMHGFGGKANTTLAGYKIGAIGSPAPTPTATTPTPSPTATTPTPSPTATTPAVTPCTVSGHDDDDDEDGDDNDHGSANCGASDTATSVSKRHLSIAELLALSPAALAALSNASLERFKGNAQLRKLSAAQIAALNSKQIKALGLNKIRFDDRQKQAFEKAKKHH